MKLQNFLGTNLRYDVQAIGADKELSTQIQTRLIQLNLLRPPADGLFGPLSTAALHRFQSLTNCKEAGFLGAVTAKKLIETKLTDLPAGIPSLKVVRNTVLKSRPIASTDLSEAEKQEVVAGKTFELVAYAPVRGHIRVALRSEVVKKSSVWYIYKPHAQIYEGNILVYPKPKPATVELKIPYKSQRDNFLNPSGSCNVTSLAMCLEFLGAKRRTQSGQLEDELYRYALNNGYSRHDPYDLAEIVRDYGCQDFFTKTATIEDVKDWLALGYPIVVHGYFTSFGHIIVLIGYDDKGFIVNDPYGEWYNNGYDTSASGAGLHYSYNLIQSVCMADGNFWVHFISK